jgi:hypothetical protein
MELMSRWTSGEMTSALGPSDAVGCVFDPLAGVVVVGDAGAGTALVDGAAGAVVGIGSADRCVVVVVSKVGGGWGGGRVVVVDPGVCAVVVVARPPELDDVVVVPSASADHVPPVHVAAAVTLAMAATMTTN